MSSLWFLCCRDILRADPVLLTSSRSDDADCSVHDGSRDIEGGLRPLSVHRGGVAALTSRPAGLTETQWHGPYLDAAIPKDPWGHDYVYACPGVHNTNGFDVYSLGPDGASKSGGEDYDNISNWPKRRTMR